MNKKALTALFTAGFMVMSLLPAGAVNGENTAESTAVTQTTEQTTAANKAAEETAETTAETTAQTTSETTAETVQTTAQTEAETDETASEPVLTAETDEQPSTLEASPESDFRVGMGSHRVIGDTFEEGYGIYGYNGSGGDVVIPETIDGMKVVRIDSFYGNSTDPSDYAPITSITIPSTVTRIDERAFAFFPPTLKEIKVENGNPTYYSYDGMLMSRNGSGWQENVSTIVWCPKGISGDVILPKGVEMIGEYAFYGCSSITSVDIPNTCKVIELYAFSNCSSLKTVTIPDSVEDMYSTIFASPFEDCHALTAINVDANNSSYYSVDGVLYAKGDESVVSGKDGILLYPASKTAGSFEIPAGIGYIGSGAFSDCVSLQNITLPDGLEYIASHAFEGTSVKSINVPGSVDCVETFTFYCASLEKIVFEGNAPLVVDEKYGEEEESLFLIDGQNTVIYYYEGAAGFTTPEWKGVSCYPLANTGTIGGTAASEAVTVNPYGTQAAAVAGNLENVSSGALPSGGVFLSVTAPDTQSGAAKTAYDSAVSGNRTLLG